MAPWSHLRQRTLFVLAVIVPSIVLVGMTLRMIGQERELSEKRERDEEQRTLAEVRTELGSRLERILLQETTRIVAGSPGRMPAGDVDVVLSAQLRDGHLVLPWEADTGSSAARQALEESKFAAAHAEATAVELRDGRATDAVVHYERMLAEFRHPVQIGFVRLSLARALRTSGAQRAAEEQYDRLLALPAHVVDDFGIPLFLYAAERLSTEKSVREKVVQRLDQDLLTDRVRNPVEVYMMREVASSLSGSNDSTTTSDVAQSLSDRTEALASVLDLALALQDELSHVMALQDFARQANRAASVWTLHGDEPWLVHVNQSADETGALLVALRTKAIFQAVADRVRTMNDRPVRIELRASATSDAVALGGPFPGLSAEFTPLGSVDRGGRWDMQRYFSFVVLPLVLGLTMFGGYMLWRDVQRESEISGLRSQFVSSVSHELRTPLTAIRMYAETLLMRRLADKQMQKEYLETIVQESERLSRLLSNVLDFSKIERSERAYRLVPSSLPEVVRSAVRAMQFPIEQGGFHLQLQIDDDIPLFALDQDAMQQAILNLVTNALKFSGDGRDIGLSLSRQNGGALIAVRDSGMGIAPEEQARIFEKFYRAPSTTTDHVPGAGLGLTIVDHIVKAHGGRVLIDSQPGHGSTFTIHLPLESNA